ncbi:unnamed protein product [Rotaria socialis]|uniref:MULE transposase domain-containing protein n=1 Tax=Rotaria socialis TaxID=392032 RepID=A0A820ZSM4_9BILA|nr:unnamed protein product [Rotaria socialis]CAF4566664.1 unnamed protein product [Rotaria socialis]CAF4680558.1 unnamed protein product [Rotaria socialis]CAF4885803.1 unnamed protein product [Rotaria socialis]CAF4930056.1 unnamed protein product [Rotaria socialis]
MNELTPIGMIYDEEMSKTSMSTAAVAILPTVHELYESIAKSRRKRVPPIPESCIFDIPEYDVQLDLLLNSPIVYMDGPFSKTPTHFFQLFVMHADNLDICVPCVFALLVDQKATTYKQIFVELKNIASKKGIIFSPLLIMSDFELGLASSVKADVNKSRDLADNNNIQSMSDKVVGGFDEIRDATRCLPDAPMEELLQYFEKNWITNIELWNLFGLDNRTNNACEGGVYNLAISKKSS